MPVTVPEWQQLALYAVGAALVIMLLQRIPVIGRLIRFAISAALLAFLIFLVLQQAPYQPELARLTERFGLDDQQVAGKELRVSLSSDGHFWAVASINGVKRRMLIDSGATVTAISSQTARDAPRRFRRGPGAGRAAHRQRRRPGATGRVDELRVGNIVARNLRIVTAPGLGDLDVLGMNFLSKLESWRVEGKTLILVPHHPQSGGS